MGWMSLCGVLLGCSSLGRQPGSATPSPLKVVVGPVILEAPITKSTQIYSFEERPSPEIEPVLLAQLKDEIQIKGQRFLAEHLARQPGLRVVPFDETRRLLADLAPAGVPLSDDQVRALADQTGADVVISGLIHDYGAVRWQYWAAGLAIHSTTELLVIGVASGWNPIIVVPAYFLDVVTDVPIWYGGADVFGFAFRPVRVHGDAVQLRNCEGLIWTKDELVVRVPGKALAEYPLEKQKLKEVQLEANLNRAMAEIADTAGEKLALQACRQDGKPEKIRGFSLSSLLDLLI
jgi:hypothetical protein